MDVEHKTLDMLLKKTDMAFKELLKNPDSPELNQAYESAKNELNSHLQEMRTSMKGKYKDY
ncbi:hypothetical protein OE749_03325 [Aestuariibacter sp. AA17]|uniref:Uncharacterized protein n=1 Tax=Fluctibacter corallii TaxID=2984329 RepID=A0ABT3A4Z7_9ALTE|nr:hypothetical protein [Aestuariibacter sp. AA17]MCV2883733.1 hypothetical protein [Aestuariibacter sp. AA17]